MAETVMCINEEQNLYLYMFCCSMCSILLAQNSSVLFTVLCAAFDVNSAMSSHKLTGSTLCRREVLAQPDGYTGTLGAVEQVILHDCTSVFLV